MQRVYAQCPGRQLCPRPGGGLSASCRDGEFHVRRTRVVRPVRRRRVSRVATPPGGVGALGRIHTRTRCCLPVGGGPSNVGDVEVGGRGGSVSVSDAPRGRRKLPRPRQELPWTAAATVHPWWLFVRRRRLFRVPFGAVLPSSGAFRGGVRGVGNRNDPYITAAVATSAGARSSAVSWCRAGSYSYRPRPLRYVERLSSGGGNRNYPYIVTAPVSAWRTVVAVWRPMAHAAGVAQRGRSE